MIAAMTRIGWLPAPRIRVELTNPSTKSRVIRLVGIAFEDLHPARADAKWKVERASTLSVVNVRTAFVAIALGAASLSQSVENPAVGWER